MAAAWTPLFSAEAELCSGRWKSPLSVKLGFCFSTCSQFSIIECFSVIILRAYNSLPCPIFSSDNFGFQCSTYAGVSMCTVCVCGGDFVGAIRQLFQLKWLISTGIGLHQHFWFWGESRQNGLRSLCPLCISVGPTAQRFCSLLRLLGMPRLRVGTIWVNALYRPRCSSQGWVSQPWVQRALKLSDIRKVEHYLSSNKSHYFAQDLSILSSWCQV